MSEVLPHGGSTLGVEISTFPQKDILDTALYYSSHGLSVIPIYLDGSKAPWLESQKPFSEARATDEQITEWFEAEPKGLGIVCGNVSGGLGVLDFDDGGSCYQDFISGVKLYPGGEELLSRLPRVRTPSGGYHLYFRTSNVRHDPVKGIVSEIRRVVRAETAPDHVGKKTMLLETRGESCYVLAPGCPETAHPDGKPYILEHGDLAIIPTLMESQEKILMLEASHFNRNNPPKAPSAEALDLILSKLDGVRVRTETQWMSLCPAHGDTTPSLSIGFLNDAFCFHCFGGCEQQAVRAALRDRGVSLPASVAKARSALSPSPDVVFREPTTSITTPISWLNYPVLAEGRVTILAGSPGAGKSTYAQREAARLSKTCGVFMFTEDMETDTRRRLVAMGANLSNIRISGLSFQSQGLLKLEAGERSLAGWLTRVFEQSLLPSYGNPDWCEIPKLLVLDTIKEILPEGIFNGQSDVSKAISPVRVLSERFQVATLMTTHLRKGIMGDPKIADVGGSTDWTGSCDIVWAVVREDESERVRFVNLKNRLGPIQERMYKRIVEAHRNGVSFPNLVDAE